MWKAHSPTVAHRDLDLNRGSHGCEPRDFITELSVILELSFPNSVYYRGHSRGRSSALKSTIQSRARQRTANSHLPENPPISLPHTNRGPIPGRLTKNTPITAHLMPKAPLMNQSNLVITAAYHLHQIWLNEWTKPISRFLKPSSPSQKWTSHRSLSYVIVNKKRHACLDSKKSHEFLHPLSQFCFIALCTEGKIRSTMGCVAGWHI